MTTKTPYRVEKVGRLNVCKENGPFIALACDEAVAREITRRWNAHDALVAATRSVERLMNPFHDPILLTIEERDAIRAALALAGKE